MKFTWLLVCLDGTIVGVFGSALGDEAERCFEEVRLRVVGTSSVVTREPMRSSRRPSVGERLS